jgi:hypothetical protein
MKRRGVCYDVGRVMWGQNWRPELSAARARRELAIIRDDLHCTAVRICGEDLDRLTTVAAQALDLGLEVWLPPELWDHSPADTLDYVNAAAERAGELHSHRPGQVVLSVGSELTLFMDGIVPGATFLERLQHPDFWEPVRAGAHNGPLDAFLAEATARAREHFGGRLTYASVPLETVAWDRFDVVGLDLYRDVRIRDRFGEVLGRYFAFGRPVAITEFGCCTYRGAADAGGRGFAIIDMTSAREGAPHRLDGVYVRDEAEQAREVVEMLEAFDRAGVDASFVMTFVDPLHPFSEDPVHDLDMASYALVRSLSDQPGATYPDLPWEPKEAFRAVAGWYGTRAHRLT